MKGCKIMTVLVLAMGIGLFPIRDALAAKHHVLESHRARMEFALGLLAIDIVIGVYWYVTHAAGTYQSPGPVNPLNNHDLADTKCSTGERKDSCPSSGGIVVFTW